MLKDEDQHRGLPQIPILNQGPLWIRVDPLIRRPPDPVRTGQAQERSNPWEKGSQRWLSSS
jgi:hypothetical protein